MASVSMRKNTLLIIFLPIFFAVIAIVFGMAGQVSAQNPIVCENNGKCQPEIIKIETNYDNAKVYIRDCGELCKDVYLAYSKDPTSAPAEIRAVPDYDAESSLLVLKVTALDTNSSYFFKIKCADTGRCVEYSEPHEVRTSQCTIVYDILSGNTQVATCGNQKVTKIAAFADNGQTIYIDTIKKYSLPVFLLSSLTTMSLVLTRKNKCHKFKTRTRNIYRTKTAKA